jgi:hypothetical protein
MAAIMPGMIPPVPAGAGAMLRMHMFAGTEYVKEPGDESACRHRVLAQAMNAYNAWVGRNAARQIVVTGFVTNNKTTSCANARLLMESVITVTYQGDDNA